MEQHVYVKRSLLGVCFCLMPAVLDSQDVKIKQIGQTNCFLFVQECKPAYKSIGTGFKFGGIDFKSGPVTKVGEISLEPKLLENVGAVVRTLDTARVDRCGRLNVVSSCDPTRSGLMLVSAFSSEQLNLLTIVIQLNANDKSKLEGEIVKWLLQTTEGMLKIVEKTRTSTASVESDKAFEVSATNGRQAALTRLKLDADSPEARAIRSRSVMELFQQ